MPENENTIMPQEDSIYGPYRPQLESVKDELLEKLEVLRVQLKEEYDSDPIEHILARIKSEESMREKCIRKGLPVTTESALEKLYDAIGLRVVCAFVSDVYRVRDYLEGLEDCEIIEEKDYIRHAKPNGYRSYHLILKVHGRWHAEFQIRTISQDTWAALEHHLSYKKQLGGNVTLIEKELKRCADELASTDLSMQTIRDMIIGSDD